MTPWPRTAFFIAAVSLVAACGSDTRSAPPDDPSNAADHQNPSILTTVPAVPEDPATDPSNGVDPIVTDPVASTPEPPASRIYEGDDYPPELTALIGLAINDLSERLGAGPDSLRVATVEEVVWPNGGLGCPSPDMKYTQVPVDGLRIVLTHDGLRYVYHSGGSAEPFLCLPSAVKGAGEPTTQHTLPLPDDSDLDGAVLRSEESIPRNGSAPTDQAGGPGGEPDV